MQRDEFGGIVLDAPADSQQPSPAPPAGQQRDEFGGTIVSQPGDRLGGMLHQLGADRVGFLQRADEEAASDINIREKGIGKITQPDGSVTYGPGATPPTALTPSDKQAIINAYRQKYNVAGPEQTYPQMEGQVRGASQQAYESTHNPAVNAAANFGGAMGSSLGNFGVGVLGTVAPQTAASLREGIQQGYQYNPDSAMATAGGIVGNTLPMIPALASGPGGIEAITTAMMTSSAFGNVRTDVAQRRAAGENIPVPNELMSAALQGMVMLGISKVRLAQIQQVPADAAMFRQGIARAVQAYATNMGYQANDLMAMQVADNAINSYFTGSGTPLSQGVAEAGLMGLASSPAMTAVGAVGQARRGVNNAAPTAQPPQGLTSELAQGPKIPTPAELGSIVQPTSIFLKAQPKVRVNEGETSRGIRVAFDNPVDKALYVLAQPRQGKLGVEAASVIASAGVPQDQVQSRSAEVKARVEQMAQGHEGDVLNYPSQETTNVPVSSTPEVAPPQPTAESTPPVNEPAPQAAATPEAPSLKPGEEQGSLFIPGRNRQPDVPAAVREAAAVVKGFKPETPANASQVQARDAFRTRGVELVFYSGEGRGVRLARDADNVLFINRKNVAGDLHEAVAHEFMHELKATRPGLFKEFMDAIPKDLLTEAQQAYQDNFSKFRPGEKLAPEKLLEEGVATIFGKTAMHGRVAAEMLNKNPSLFQRVGDFVRQFTSKFSTKAKLVNEAIKTFQKTYEAPVGGGRVEKPAEAQTFRTTPTRRMVIEPTEAPSFLPSPSEKIRQEAEEYTKGAGVPFHPETSYAPVNVERAKTIAAEYDAASHNPNDPKVKASYDAFKKETLDQWNYLKSKGVQFEEWGREGQPYKDSAEMIRDVRDNKHLYFFQGGTMPADHPLAEKAPGTPYTYNDVFRAVHDYFGHAKEGVGFGPRGEENAWRSHSQMYSEAARGAMTAETRGQNSWVNFGPHGEHNQANPTETKYAEQKATLLSPEYSKLDRENVQQAGDALHQTLRQQTGMDKLEAIHADLKALSARQDQQIAERPSYLPDFKPRKEENKNTLAELQQHLTPEEYGTLNNRAVQVAIKTFQDTPSVKEFSRTAEAGKAMKGWYEKATAAIGQIFGTDQRRFTTLLAADSPRQSVAMNLRESLAVWNAWERAGRPDNEGRVRAIVESVVPPEFSSRIPNAVRALTAPESQTPTLSGYKVESFKGNLLGDLNRVTNDTWMAKFGGLPQDIFADNGGYLGFTAKVRRVAKSMGWQPAEVQETIWSFFKALTERVNSRTTGREALQNLTHEDIANIPAFHQLLEDSNVRSLLDQLGISDGSIRRAGEAAAAIGQGEERPSGYIAEGRDRVLEGVAQRAEENSRYEPKPAVKAQSALFLPGEKFYDEDLKPVAERMAQGVADALRGVRNLVAPQTAGPQAKEVKGILRERGAELAQRWDRLGEAFGEAKKFFDRVPVPESRDFIDAIENGRKQARPELQPVADAVRTVLDNRLAQVQGLGTGKLATFVKDYFPHLWENPTKAAKVYAEAASKRPIEGGKKFLKQRTLPTLADGIARGLEPVTENPVEAMMLRVREMDKYITAQQSFAEMNGRGLVRKIKARDPMPPGYAKIDDNIATIYAKPSRRGAIQIQGYYVAPEEVANVVNNHLSPGLRGNKNFGGSFRGYLGLGNLMNQVQLNLSGFHLLNTTLDSSASKLALSLKQLAAGDFKGAAKSGLLSATLVGPSAENLWNGSKLLKEWKSPGTTTPDIAAIVDAMKAAGGRVKMDDFYHTGATDKMMEAFRSGNILGGSFRAPFALIEQAAKPIMEQVVPRMKMGVFMDMAKFELQRLGPSAGRADMREALGRAWDSVDNRMGELVYDNLFWHKAVKDIAMASTRSVGWNLGTLRELGGGLLDTLKAGKEIATGNPRNAEFTHRMAYTVAMPALAAIVGGMTHFMLTGKRPDELKDWFFPKTGEKDKDGHDVRLALPSYMKDVLAYGRDPVKTIGDKVHPMLNTIMEMLRNEDFYGTEIANKDDPFVQRQLDRLKFVAKQFVPFGIREAVQLHGEGQGLKSLLPLAGIVKARKDITSTPAEVKASELMREQRSIGSRTHQEAERSQLIRDIAGTLKTDRVEGIGQLQQAMQAEKLVPSDLERVKEHVQFSGLERAIRHFDIGDSMKVWELMDPEEKRKLGPLMFKKLRGATSVNREDKVRFMQELQADWKEVQP